MTHKLPPLNALRAFEASARHQSFKLAGNELHVTPGAISQQVKALEDVLGVQLFRRLHRSLQLTTAGEDYLPHIREAFRQISKATEELVPKQAMEAINLGVDPSFAVKWLIPRLDGFLDAHPTIEVRVQEAEDLISLNEGRVDLMILRGPRHDSGIRSDLIMHERWRPVCHPNVPTSDKPLLQPEDLQHHTLLHRQTQDAWRQWLFRAGVDHVVPTTRLVFSDDTLMFAALREKQGVGLALDYEVRGELESGCLVYPFDARDIGEVSFHLLAPEGTAECPEVIDFRRWLLGEARRSVDPVKLVS